MKIQHVLVSIILGMALFVVIDYFVSSYYGGPVTVTTSAPTQMAFPATASMIMPEPQTVQEVQPVQQAQPLSQSGSCSRPIKNSFGCQGTVTRDTLAGFAQGGSDLSLTVGQGIIVYVELNDYYMFLFNYNGNDVPLWVSTSDIYISE